MYENGLIQLYPSLALAYEALGNPDEANIFRYDFIRTTPDGRTLQITASDIPIRFGGNYKAELVTCCDVFITDVTSSVFIYEGTNTVTGIPNIAFEMIGLLVGNPVQYMQRVHLKITQLDLPTNVFYSTPFCISPDTKGTKVITYKGIGEMFGVDYSQFDFYQEIRIKCAYQNPTDESEIATYDQSNSNRIQFSPFRVLGYSHILEYLHNMEKIGLSAIVRLPIVYVDGIRSTSTKYSTDDAPFGSSNFYGGKLTAYLDKRQKLTLTNQIAPVFASISLFPLNTYTPANFASVTEIGANFNSDIVIGNGTLTVYDALTDLPLLTYNQSQVLILSRTAFHIPAFSSNTLGIGSYYIKFTSGLIADIYGNLPVIPAWSFDIANGEFDATEFDNTEFLTV